MYPYTPIVHAVYGSSHEIFKLLMSLPTLERSLEKVSINTSHTTQFKLINIIQ